MSVGHFETVRVQQATSNSDSEADIRQDHQPGQCVGPQQSPHKHQEGVRQGDIGRVELVIKLL